MENGLAIKKYFLTDNEIVVKYKNKSVERKKINKINLKKLINQLNKQFPFDTESTTKKLDSMYSKVAYITFIVTLIEGIIFLNLLISFEVGTMSVFITCSILSAICLILHLVFLLISLILLKKTKKKYKICLGKDYVIERYESLYGSVKIKIKGEKEIKEEVEVKEEVKPIKPKKDNSILKDKMNKVKEKIVVIGHKAKEIGTKEIRVRDIVKKNITKEKLNAAKEKLANAGHKAKEKAVIIGRKAKEIGTKEIRVRDIVKKNITKEKKNNVGKKIEEVKPKLTKEEMQKKQAKKQKAKVKKRKAKKNGSKPKKKTTK